nr:MAG TPA: terminase small subunit [Caudoviricetes sp.]
MKRKPNSANSYSDALIAGLIERYGVVNDESNEVEIPDEWYYLIDTFAMQYKLQKQCEKEIRDKGICNYENGARRHPLLTTLKELVASNMRILNLIGANPYYRERCKPKEQGNEDISAEDFISALTSSNYEGEE